MSNESIISPVYDYNSTTYDNGTAVVEYWSVAFGVIVSIILSIAVLLAIVGNAMVIIVVIRHRGMRTRTNLFLVNLAIADFLVGSLAVPASIVTLLAGKWVFNDVFCVINGFLNPFCLFASIHTLMYISIHKYYSITRPFSSSFKLRCVLFMMAFSWIWAGFCATITVYGLNHVTYKPFTSQCGPTYPHDVKGYIHHAIIIISNFIIPLFILLFCYATMFKEIRAHTKRLQQNTTLEQDVVLAQQKKVAVTLFIVLACFIICWLPYNFYTIYVTSLKDKEHFSGYINPLVYMFGYLNSACNPIIYAFRSPSFREGYKEILCQTPQYVISDDLLTDDGMVLFRRMSSFFSGTRSIPRTPSTPDEFVYHSTTSLNSHLKNNVKMKFKREKSLTEMMRSAPKHGNGSSIIQQDNSVVIMKAGKIVSVLQNSIHKSNSLPGNRLFRSNEFPGMMASNKVGQREAVELSPLIKNGKLSFVDSKLEDDDSDEVFERETDRDAESVQESNVKQNSESTDSAEMKTLLGSPVITVSPAGSGDKSTEDLQRQQEEEEEEDLGIMITVHEDNSMLSAMPLTPSTKLRLGCSDMFLNINNEDKQKTHRKMTISKSSDAISRHTLLRLPSVEHLDIPVGLSRSASDNNLKKHKHGSPNPFRKKLMFSKVKS